MSDTWAGQDCPHLIQRPTIQLIHIGGPTIQTYEGAHQGPGTMLLKSGTVPEIRDVEAYYLAKLGSHRLSLGAF